MSNLPKIGDTIKTGTLEEIKAIEGVTRYSDERIMCRGEFGYLSVINLGLLGTDMTVCIEPESNDTYIYLEGYGEELSYPKWAHQALLNKPTTTTKPPRKSALEKELTQLEARLALVKEGIKLESEVKSCTNELKVKKARLAEIRKGN